MSDFQFGKRVINSVIPFLKKFAVVIIFLVFLIVQICAICKTTVVHHDETSSLIVSTSANTLDTVRKIYYCYFTWEEGVEYKYDDAYKFLFVPQKGLKHLTSDLQKIRAQYVDPSHPNLYYSVLRIWNTSLTNYSPLGMLKHSKFLNLLFYLISFFFMYKLLNLLFDRKDEVYLGLIFAFGSTALISLSSLAREYALQSALFVAVTYIFTLLYKKSENEKVTESNICWYGFGIGLFLLSGYGALIYTAIHSVFIFLTLLFKKNKDNITGFIAVFIIAFLVIKILCPYYFHFVMNNDHKYNLYSMNSYHYQVKTILHSLYVLKHVFIKYIYYTVPILLSILAFTLNIFKQIRNHNFKEFLAKKDLCCLFLIFISFIWSVIVIIVTPFKMSRFILPAFPIFSLLYVILLKKSNKLFKIIITCVFLTVTFNHLIKNVYYDSDRETNFIETTHPYSAPVVLNDNHWSIPPYIFLNSNKIESITYFKDIPPKNYKHKNYYLITKKHIPQSDNIEPIWWFVDDVVYYVHNK